MTHMPAFRFFDPWIELESLGGVAVPPSPVSAGRAEAAAPETLAALAALADIPEAFADATPNPKKPIVILEEAQEEPGGTVESEQPFPRLGIPGIPEEPVLLRDGRRLWRFSQVETYPPDRATALIDRAHWSGAVLIADGRELIVVERRSSSLPIETLCELRRCAGGVISVLHRGSRVSRHPSTPRESC
jgi:hypothetical protein